MYNIYYIIQFHTIFEMIYDKNGGMKTENTFIMVLYMHEHGLIQHKYTSH